MSYPCPRCGTRLIESDDDVNDYELEGAQVRHTIKRCAEVEKAEALATAPKETGHAPRDDRNQ